MKNYKNFDTRAFFHFYSIPFQESSNISTDAYFALDCPFCGKEDGLGIPKDGSIYGTCWRCGYKNAYTVIQGLTGESDIKGILKKFSTGYVSKYICEENTESIIKRPTKIIVPGKTGWHPNLEAWKYLEEVRGFNPREIIPKYDLRYNTFGAGLHSYRITFPFYVDGKCVTYQSKSYRDNPIPYVACKNEESIADIKHILYGVDDCPSDRGILLEGTFDRIRVGKGSLAVCGTSTTVEQANFVRSRLKYAFILFDQGEEEAQEKAEKFAYQIGSGRTQVEILNITDEKIDPDDYFRKHPDDLIYLKKELKVY